MRALRNGSEDQLRASFEGTARGRSERLTAGRSFGLKLKTPLERWDIQDNDRTRLVNMQEESWQAVNSARRLMPGDDNLSRFVA